MFSDTRHRAAYRNHGNRLKTKRHNVRETGKSSDSLKERHA
jgi:hypothetical protein